MEEKGFRCHSGTSLDMFSILSDQALICNWSKSSSFSCVRPTNKQAELFELRWMGIAALLLVLVDSLVRLHS